MFEWIGGLFVLGQDGGFFIFNHLYSLFIKKWIQIWWTHHIGVWRIKVVS